MSVNNYISKIANYYRANLIKLHSADEEYGAANCFDFSKYGDHSAWHNDQSAYHRYGVGADGRRSMRFTQSNEHKINLYTATFALNFSNSKGAVLCLCKENNWSSGYTSETVLNIQRTPTGTQERVLIYKSVATPGALIFRHRSVTADVISTIASGTHGSPAGWFFLGLNWDSAGAGTLQPYYRVLGGTVYKPSSTAGVSAWTVSTLASTYCCFGGQNTTNTNNNWEGEGGLLAIWAGINLTDADFQNMTKV